MKSLFRAIARSLDFGAKPRFDAAWDDFIQRGRARPIIVGDPVAVRDLPTIHAAAQACPVQPPLNTWWKGPEAAGIPIDIRVDNQVSTADTLLHLATAIWQTLVHDLGLPDAYGGFLRPPTQDHIQLAIWVPRSRTRVLIAPALHATGDTISLAIAHVVWWRQEWMDAHPDTHWWWADLSTHYADHFEAEGGLYHDAAEAWRNDRRRFHKGVFGGIDFDAVQGSTVYRDEAFNSFYHFGIGSPIVPTGSEPGVYLRNVKIRLAQASQYWKVSYEGDGTPRREPPEPDAGAHHKAIVPKF